MWENVIGITNDQAGTNTGVEALINAPTIGGGRKATQARRQAAAEAVLATGGFDTSITNYQSLLAMAKQQGAVGTGACGACKICGQTGHLTKQCRNVLPGGADGEAGGAGPSIAVPVPPSDNEADDLSFDSSDSSDEEQRRKKRRKEKKEKRRSKKSKKEKKEKSSKKHKRSSKDKKSKKKKRRHSSSSGSSGSSGSDSG
ncbi:CAX-interacting 4 [Micractinium conductrix]|uniref:CAX-interacting 4 n=1 Tax=Micractinium conductrix TaxID=554055 RepID=A0A2P6UZS5_9CHLO|nr:CAX-interacting 4 [Micractinium conductrix]|eukprot:PSC67345.1 CAX-interacting 4 [Micractinium conductrix]